MFMELSESYNGGVVATGESMSLTSDGAPVIVRLSGGWGGTLSVGMHNPPREESRDMKLSQLVPLIDWVAKQQQHR
jgi:hypothetical protein